MNRHVYYTCTRVKDKDCKCGYINETQLIEQFIGIIDQVDINEASIKEKIKAEIERFKKLQMIILGTKESIDIRDVDVRNYAKFILTGGSIEEKRDFMRCLKSEIVLSSKKISLRQ